MAVDVSPRAGDDGKDRLRMIVPAPGIRIAGDVLRADLRSDGLLR